MTFLSVFHQQDLILKFTAIYGNDRNEKMQIFNSGNCISDNYNLFLFECTGFHFKLTLLTLQTLLAGIVSQGLVDCEIRLADSDSHLPNRQEDFFQGQKKSVSLNEHHKQRSKQLNFLVVHWSTESLTCIFTLLNWKLTDIRDLQQITTATAIRMRQKI